MKGAPPISNSLATSSNEGEVFRLMRATFVDFPEAFGRRMNRQGG